MEEKKLQKPNIETKRKILFAVCGCVLSLLSMLPFFILGEKSIITYNDQLDGEMITYILNAKHLFEGLETYPELMNGIPVAGMVSPAPLFVLLFKVFTPFTSFMIMTAVTRISGFLSTYLLCEKVTKKNLISFAVGLAFMMMPFYPVYGLCIPGQAFVWLSVLYLLEEKPSKGKIIVSYLLTVLYALTSSLALVGFAVIAALAAVTLTVIFKSRIKALRLLFVEAALIVSYAFCNVPLIKQILGIGRSFVSHKSEILIADRKFSDIISSYIFGGYPYTACSQKIILAFFAVALITAIIVILVKKPEKSAILKHRAIAFNLIFILVTIVLITFYNLPFMISLRNSSSGVMHEFNFERISWLLPVAWMILLAESASLLDDCIKMLFKKESKKMPVIFGLLPGIIICILIFAVSGYNSDVKTSAMRIVKGSEYKQVSFGQFYSKELFDEVEKVTGRNRNEYKVISMGLLPASAAYNGFYCLDAYSNNYDVNYKHEFRKIMENELDKSDYYTSYFDEWGNRCYIYLAAYKTGINADFYNITFNDIDINFAKAKEMGAEYVISASPITGFEDKGLKLLNPEPVRSDDCWYELYVYEIL